MDINLFKMFGQVAGIGGIALGIFLYLFKDLLKKIKVPGLKREQWFKVIIIFMVLVWLLAIIGIGAWLFSIYLNPDTTNLKSFTLPGSKSAHFTKELLKRHTELSKRYRLVENHVQIADLWEQMFEKGRILYNVTHGSVTVLFGQNNEFKKFETIDALVSSGPGMATIHWNVVNQMIETIIDKQNNHKYKELIEAGLIRGGIGTIYLRESLYPYLGYPVADKYEFLTKDVILIDGGFYQLVSGLPNRRAYAEPSIAFELNYQTGRFRRYVLPFFE